MHPLYLRGCNFPELLRQHTPSPRSLIYAQRRQLGFTAAAVIFEVSCILHDRTHDRTRIFLESAYMYGAIDAALTRFVLSEITQRNKCCFSTINLRSQAHPFLINQIGDFVNLSSHFLPFHFNWTFRVKRKLSMEYKRYKKQHSLLVCTSHSSRMRGKKKS